MVTNTVHSISCSCLYVRCSSHRMGLHIWPILLVTLQTILHCGRCLPLFQFDMNQVCVFCFYILQLMLGFYLVYIKKGLDMVSVSSQTSITCNVHIYGVSKFIWKNWRHSMLNDFFSFFPDYLYCCKDFYCTFCPLAGSHKQKSHGFRSSKQEGHNPLFWTLHILGIVVHNICGMSFISLFCRLKFWGGF